MNQWELFNGQLSQLQTSVAELQEKINAVGRGPVTDPELRQLGGLIDIVSVAIDEMNQEIPNS